MRRASAVALLLLLIATQVLAQSHAVRARGDRAYPPYEYLDDQGRPAGFNVDLFREVCEVMGLRCEVSLGPWSEVRTQLETGKIDALMGMFQSPERARLVSFSSPHMQVSYSIFVPQGSPISGPEDLRGRRVLVEEGDIMHDYLRTSGLSAQIMTVTDPADALRGLSAGRHDAALLARLQTLYLMDKMGIRNVVPVGRPIQTRAYCFAVRKESTELLAQLNEGLSILRGNGRYDEIYQKWFGRVERHTTLGELLWAGRWYLVGVLALVLAILAWNLALRRQVRAKTLRVYEELEERRQAERELFRAKAVLEASFEQTPTPMILLSLPEGVLRVVNPACLGVFGITESSLLVGKSLAEVHLEWENLYPDGTPVMPEDLPLTRAMLGERVINEELRVRRRDGSESWLLVSGGPILGAEGETVAALIVCADMTERRRDEAARQVLEAQVRHAQKLESLGILAGGIAHDFNNLLMGITGNVDLVRESMSPDSPALSYVSEIETASRRAADLCRQMLAYSGRGSFVIEPVDLNIIVNEMLNLLDSSISKKAALRLNLADQIPSIEGDATQIRQVIMNLITNASDALEGKDGLISIRTGAQRCDREYLREISLDNELRPGSYVFLEVSDTGCGMDAETRERIFEPFFTTKFTGRGLGMAAVLGIIRAHHGGIRIYSERGHGSTFKILFPAIDGERQVSVAREVAGESWQGSGLVLLVDDDPLVRNVGKSMLERIGFVVMLAEDGLEALSVMQEKRGEVRLVILDLTMPRMDGEETFRELQGLAPEIPVLISSGYSEQDTMDRFLGRGLAGFIQKPYQLGDLRARLHEVLGKD